jgi:drug/metabolite transporter (DMT)-like permease
VLLGERLDPSQWVGVVIVLGAVLLITRRSSAVASVPAEGPLGAEA